MFFSWLMEEGGRVRGYKKPFWRVLKVLSEEKMKGLSGGTKRIITTFVKTL